MNAFVYLCWIVGQMIYSAKLNQGCIGQTVKIFRSSKCCLTEFWYDNRNIILIIDYWLTSTISRADIFADPFRQHHVLYIEVARSFSRLRHKY